MLEFVPDQYKIREMCKLAVLKEPEILFDVAGRYKIQ